MKLILIRHAVAMDRVEFASTKQHDGERPLTEDGAKKMHKAAQGLARLVSDFDLLLVSPLTRTRQTAEILSAHLKIKKQLLDKKLQPECSIHGFFSHVIPLLPKRNSDNLVVGIVGHEPHLSHLLQMALGGMHEESLSTNLELKKGGACSLDFAKSFAPGEGRLEWFAKPGLLRSLS